MSTPIPALKFAFQVTIEGVSDSSNQECFYAVEGLGMMYQLDRYTPGGYGTSYALPTRYEPQPLVFKRPLVNGGSTAITTWCTTALDTCVFKPTTVNVFILNQEKEINNHWAVEGAYPIGLKISSLSLETGDPVVMETITVAYTRLKRVK